MNMLLKEDFIFRPLESNDFKALTAFFEGLLPTTRRFYQLQSYDAEMAKEYIDAIDRYDKHRFIISCPPSSFIAGLFEFSLDIPEDDQERYAKYQISLNKKNDCRFGPCIADDFQNKGIGSMFFPEVISVAKSLGKKRIILWGGVFLENKQAVKFYEKNGFRKLGSYYDQNNRQVLDMILEIN